MQDYVIPYEFQGLFRIKANSAKEAREFFEACSDEELANTAQFWSDDRTFTPEEYEAAIKETREGPAPA